MHRILALLGLLLPVNAFTSGGRNEAVRIAVVVSHDAAPYREALAGLRRELTERLPAASLSVVQLRGDSTRASATMAADSVSSKQLSDADLVVTLGTLAMRQAFHRLKDVPIVAGMILEPNQLAGAKNATGVYLQFPVETELRWLARLLPSERRVGVLYHSEQNEARVTEARQVAQGVNLTIHALHVDGPGQIPDALENLQNRADVLWGLTDPVVFNPETAKSLLLFSFRHRIPLIGQSTPWVKAGALYALDRDYDDIGAQCAELGVKILDGRAPRSIAPVPPRKVRYAINRKTAKQMNLDIPDRLLQEAAEVVE